ncbi:MAG: twin-arginine translocase subunit TatC [Candidatus Poseidoniaceae archaeon]|nr:twin-arginine translocase subunit TatC [Candidatus Poseidoniaceae archaeon]
MSLQLERDQQSPVQEHLNELTARVTLLLFLTSLATVAWLTQVDAILDTVLRYLNPCETGCLNLFDPAKWSAVRWMTAAVLGLLTVMPFLLQQTWSFARPGLLPAERKLLRNWFFAGIFSVILAVLSTIGLLFPFLFETGHQTHQSMQLDARYDAVHMLSIVIAVIWSEIIVACAVFAMMLAGMSGMLNEESADWWRIRIYGLTILLLFASLPEFGGLALLLGVFAIGTIEMCSRKWLRSPPPTMIGQSKIMDDEGGIRNILMVDCSCSGAALPLSKQLNAPFPIHSAHSLCTSNSEREHLLEIALQHRLTDVIISGCSSNPLPNSFKSNCHSIGCSLRGLDLLQTQSHRTLTSPFQLTEIELKIATLEDPWPESTVHERVFTLLQNSKINELILDTRPHSESWGMQLRPEQVLLQLEPKHLTSVLDTIHPLNISTTVL